MTREISNMKLRKDISKYMINYSYWNYYRSITVQTLTIKFGRLHCEDCKANYTSTISLLKIGNLLLFETICKGSVLSPTPFSVWKLQIWHWKLTGGIATDVIAIQFHSLMIRLCHHCYLTSAGNNASNG